MNFQLARTKLIKLKHGGGKTTKKDARYTSYYYQRNRLIVSPRLEESTIKRKMIQCNIVKDIMVLLFQKMVKGDFSRGKNLFLALIDAFSSKDDLR